MSPMSSTVAGRSHRRHHRRERINEMPRLTPTLWFDTQGEEVAR